MSHSTMDVTHSATERAQNFITRAQTWLRTDAAPRWILVLILLTGAYLRFSHLNWDEGHHIHPDERFLTMVTAAMELPDGLKQFFDSTQSPMSPYVKGYNFFVYGTLPLFIVRVAAEAAQKLNEALPLFEAAPGMPYNLTGYDGVHLVGRFLSGLFDLGSVCVLYVIGRRLYSRRVGLLAAGLYAFAALPLQQSHFYTVDTFGSFFALLTLYGAILVAQGGEPGRRGGGWGAYIGLGLSLGASLACRINLLPLIVIAVLAAGIRLWDEVSTLRRQGRTGDGVAVGALLQVTLFRLFVMVLITVGVFRVAQPYAFGGTSLLDFSFAPAWRSNMHDIQALMSGAADSPPGHQWTSRTPFVFPFVNMVIWGTGVFLGLAAWAGWLVATGQVVWALTGVGRGARLAAVRRVARPHFIPVAWIGGMFLWQGLQYVQSMRYLLPIYPLLALLAAWLLFWLVKQAVGFRPVWRQVAYALLAAVAIGTALWGWGFLAIYRRPLTRITASEWMYQNIPAGSVVANEHWDDPLPFSLDGKNGFKPAGFYYGLTQPERPVLDAGTQQQLIDPKTGQPMFYREGQIENYGEDTPAKREALYRWLDEADVLVLSSNRLWGSIPRLPMRYPMTTEYYRLLFEEKLGFKLAARFTSFPTILGYQFNDTGAEEAFSVYDHPEVRIYVKSENYDPAVVRSYFDSIDLDNTLQMWPRQVSKAPTGLYMTPTEAVQQQSGGTWSEMFDEGAPVNRSPALAVLAWYALLLLLGLLAFPFTFIVLRRLPDRGYGVSRVLGLLALSWLAWIGPSLKVVGFTRVWLALCLGLLIGLAAAVAWPRRKAMWAFVRGRIALLGTEEVLFLALFALFLLIRYSNPDLWHPARGGEKPMELAYLNAVIRSTHFPPYDPWHAGGFMNYYYFGWVMVASLIKLLGIVPWVAFNLAVPSLFALTGLGAFSVAYALADGDRATDFMGDEDSPVAALRVGPLLAGLAGMFLVVVIGNLGEVRLLIDQFAQRGGTPVESSVPGLGALLTALKGLVAVVSNRADLAFPNDWWYWNASRVIPDTINEFPFFTFLFADMHPHMLSLPLTLLVLAAATAYVRLTPRLGVHGGEASPWVIALPELLPILLIGFVVGALRATNTWDFPTYAIVGLLALIVLEIGRRTELIHLVREGDTQEALAFLFRGLIAVVWRFGILMVVATVAFYPFTSNYASAYAGVEAYKETTTVLPDFLTHWGFFLALAAIWLIGEIVVQRRDRQMPAWLENGLPFVLAFFAVILFAGLFLKARVWIVALPLMAVAVILGMARRIPPTRRIALFLLALALAVTMGVEVIRQQDDLGRMNTVFKFYLQAWVLFGVSTAYGLASWLGRSLTWRPGWRRLALGLTLALFVGGMLYPVFATRAKVRDRFSAEASPRGLDGMAYMTNAQYFDNGRDLRLANDRDAMLWLLRNVEGSPVILEAQIPEYRWGSRYSVYTGLPTVQGWNWHQRQQRSITPGIAVERRVAIVTELYNTTDLATTRKWLRRYNVRFIIVGELERAYYSEGGLAKFDAMLRDGELTLAYQNGAVSIYEVPGWQPGPVAPTGLGATLARGSTAPFAAASSTGAAPGPFASPLPAESPLAPAP